MKPKVYETQMNAIDNGGYDIFAPNVYYDPNLIVLEDLEKICTSLPIAKKVLKFTSGSKPLEAKYFQMYDPANNNLCGILVGIYLRNLVDKQTVIMEIQSLNEKLPKKLEKVINDYNFVLQKQA